MHALLAAKKKAVASLKKQLKKARQKKKMVEEKAAKNLGSMMTYAMVIRQHAYAQISNAKLV